MPHSSTINRRIVLNSRPVGAPTAANFRLVELNIPTPLAEQVLLRTLYLSLDPYMRGRMSDAPSYAPPVTLGDVMVGGTVSRVEASRHPDYTTGDMVLGYSGWQEYAISDGTDLTRLDAWLAEGRITYREDIVDGLENAPETFIGLLQGRNFGKQVVRVTQD